jgi:alginate O-acetyltransferase complex protein AlgI
VEFWQRWHISLSTWFRDYLYIPLGGNRVPKRRYLINIMVVFVISGLWHGANWTFAVWGLLHGMYLIIGHLTAPLRTRFKAALRMDRAGALLSIVQVFITFVLVTIAWVFFRAANISDGVYILRHMPSISGFHVSQLFTLSLPIFEMAVAFLLIALVAVTEWFLYYRPPAIMSLWSARPFRWACTYACVFATIFFGVFGHISFIYFQF